MITEKTNITVGILSVVVPSSLYLLTGGFSVGSQVAAMNAEIKLLRSEIVSQNEIQNYRIDKLERLPKN